MNIVIKKSGIGFLIVAFLFVLMSMSFKQDKQEHEHIEVEAGVHMIVPAAMIDTPY